MALRSMYCECRRYATHITKSTELIDFFSRLFSVHTRWPSYQGPKPVGLTPQDHLQGYKEQLEIAKALKPYKANAHSGEYVCSIWP